MSSYRPYRPSGIDSSEKDKYYAKEVRTFDEVFKQIKNKQKENDRQSSDDEGSELALNDEYGEYGDEVLDDQDIEGNDREILDDRILGILNVF